MAESNLAFEDRNEVSPLISDDPSWSAELERTHSEMLRVSGKILSFEELIRAKARLDPEIPESRESVALDALRKASLDRSGLEAGQEALARFPVENLRFPELKFPEVVKAEMLALDEVELLRAKSDLMARNTGHLNPVQEVFLDRSPRSVEIEEDAGRVLATRRFSEKKPSPEEKRLENEARDRALRRISSNFERGGSDGKDYRDARGNLAFRDNGNVLRAKEPDQQTIMGMLDMVEAKGWKSINISGEKSFSRQIWLEANLRGIETTGFKPSKADLEWLENLRKERMPNVITESRPRERNPAISEPERKGAPSSRSGIEGIVEDYGVANYRFSDNGAKNFYVKVRTPEGREEVAWGNDLKRHVADGVNPDGIRKGEYARFEKTAEKHEVVLTVPVRDAQGKVIGTTTKETALNKWKSERLPIRAVDSVARGYLQRHGVDLNAPAAKEYLSAVHTEASRLHSEGKLKTLKVYDTAAEKQSRASDKRVNKVRGRSSEREQSKKEIVPDAER